MKPRSSLTLLSKNFIYLLFFIFVSCSLFAQPDRNNTIELKATVVDISPTHTQVRICWRNTIPNALRHAAIRKPQGLLYWSKGFTISTADTCFLDTIPTKTVYNYCVLKDLNAYGVPNFGYISVGNKVPAALDRGNTIIVLDTTYLSLFQDNYHIFKKDLLGDGWQIDEFRVDSGTSIATIKAGIVSRYTANPSRINQVILIGKIKVPYSGDFNSTTLPPPDGHFPQHNGAWPTDAYYGDINSSSWTDATVNNTTGSRTENNNTIGDGKFDQSFLPGLQELSVGRIDMSNLPSFALSEGELLNLYFIKNHAYRHGLIDVQDSAVLDYNFGSLLGAEDFGATQCYRNMSPFYCYDAVKEDAYFTTLQNSYFKWAFGYGFGNYNSISGIGATGNFASVGREVRSIFNVFYGSYFPDWDNSDNFLRAAIAPNGSSLISVAGGRPNLFFQSMAMGKSIGYSIKESQNNLDVVNNIDLFAYYGYGTRFITTSLMGDPTLRMDYVKPIRNLVIRKDSFLSDTMRLSWQAPLNETGIDTYYVYRGAHELDSFSFIGKTTDTAYKDTVINKSQVVYYRVRASKIHTNCSGNYRNLSQAICAFTDYMEKDSFSDTLTICLGDSVGIGRNISGLEDSKNYTYSWFPNTHITPLDSHKTLVFPTTNTLYILETKDKFGITAYDSFLVNIATVPSTGITVTNQSMSCGDTVTLVSNPVATSGLNYSWVFNNGTPGSIAGATANGPHIVVFDSAGSQKVNLDITFNNGTCLFKDSIGVIINCVVLPVDLIAFTANKEHQKIRLHWATASEINNYFFRVMRSEDGVSFEQIGQVFTKAPAGNSNTLLEYDFLDKKIPNSRILFYKLIQEDYNSAQRETGVLSIRQEISQIIRPNPFTNYLELQGFGKVKNVEFYSINGTLVSAIKNPDEKVDTRHLPIGFYLIKIYTPSGIITEKLIKQ